MMLTTKHTPGPLELAVLARNQAVADELDYEECERVFLRTYNAEINRLCRLSGIYASGIGVWRGGNMGD